MKTLMRATALAAVLAASAISAQAQTAPSGAADAQFRATTLNLSAYGEIKIAPDMAMISIAVQTEAKTAGEATRLNATRMTEVMAVLRRQGIADKDIQTAGLSLNPQYTYAPNQKPKVTGYQATNQLSVRVIDLARLGAILDATVAAGINEIQGVSLGLQQPLAAENAARRKAVTAVQAKADLYAGATGLRIVRLVNLSENGGYAPAPPMPMAQARSFAAAAPETPIAGGELTVRMDLSAMFELGR
ncbi:SIMPL domain-containing protein [soil metagenome]